jgi:hypothetical protein
MGNFGIKVAKQLVVVALGAAALLGTTAVAAQGHPQAVVADTDSTTTVIAASGTPWH